MSRLQEQILEILRSSLSPILAKSTLTLVLQRSRVDLDHLRPGDAQRLQDGLQRALRLYVAEARRRDQCVAQVARLLQKRPGLRASPADEKLKINVGAEADIVVARSAGRDRCRELGFSPAVQIKVATAISELARNIVQYAGRGEVEISVVEGRQRGIQVVATDQGPGITDLESVLSGSYHSENGMGMGLSGTRNLMDDFDIQTKPGEGTKVLVRKYLL